MRLSKTARVFFRESRRYLHIFTVDHPYTPIMQACRLLLSTPNFLFAFEALIALIQVLISIRRVMNAFMAPHKPDKGGTQSALLEFYENKLNVSFG